MGESNPPKIFVSHSTKTSTGIKRLTELCRKFREPAYRKKFQILIDQSGGIPAGSQWRVHLSEWLKQCDAAVILFSKEAIRESDWVKAEATILAWRKHLDPDFKILCFLLDDATPADLHGSSYFADTLRISDYQLIRDVTEPTHVAFEIESCFASHVPERSPFENLRLKLDSILKTFSKDELESAVNNLEYPNIPSFDPQISESDRLCRALLRNPDCALELLFKVLEQIPFPNTNSSIIVEQLSTLVRGMWIEEEIIGTASKEFVRNNSQGIGAINGECFGKFTGAAVLDRVWSFKKQIKVVNAHVGDSFDEIDHQITEKMNLADIPARRIPQRIKNYPFPLVVLFHCDESDENRPVIADEDLVKDLKDKYAPLLCLIHVGTHQTLSLSYAKHLTPPIDPDQEYTQYENFLNLKSLAKDLRDNYE